VGNLLIYSEVKVAGHFLLADCWGYILRSASPKLSWILGCTGLLGPYDRKNIAAGYFVLSAENPIPADAQMSAPLAESTPRTDLG
jgi:hypothetical protein